MGDYSAVTSTLWRLLSQRRRDSSIHIDSRYFPSCIWKRNISLVKGIEWMINQWISWFQCHGVCFFLFDTQDWIKIRYRDFHFALYNSSIRTKCGPRGGGTSGAPYLQKNLWILKITPCPLPLAGTRMKDWVTKNYWSELYYVRHQINIQTGRSQERRTR
jgi:hypothetical protein